MQGLVGDIIMLLRRKRVDRGHDVGGIFVTKTREAMRPEQARLGLPVDG